MHFLYKIRLIFYDPKRTHALIFINYICRFNYIITISIFLWAINKNIHSFHFFFNANNCRGRWSEAYHIIIHLLYCFCNCGCFLLEVERFWLLVWWIHGLISSSIATSSWNSSLFPLWLVFECLFIKTSSSCLHLRCFASYLALGCNPFRVLN